MPKWEYFVVDVGLDNTVEEITEKLNILGAEGWELVFCVGSTAAWVFKRGCNH